MNKHALRVAAVLAAMPFALAGCGSSSDESPSTSASSSAEDRGAANNSSSSGFEDFWDSNPGQNVLSVLLGGYITDTVDCGQAFSMNPVLIVNTTTEDQTVSVSYDKGLAYELTFFPQISQAEQYSSGCDGGLYTGQDFNDTFTVPAGQTAQAAIISGGGQHNDIGAGSLAIGSGGDQWYDYNLSLGDDNGFKQLKLSYSNTGGTSTENNSQPGLFNVMQCSGGGYDPNSKPPSFSPDGQTISVTNTIVSQYADVGPNNPNPQLEVWQNAPICMAFLG